MLTVYRIIKIALVLFIACHAPLKAQDQRNNGYIGVGLGPSFLLGNNNIKAGTGLNLTLLNAGYVLGKGFGITGTWAGGAHVFDSEVTVYDYRGTTHTIPAQAELSYGVLMIGPMYTLNLTDDSSLDFKAKLGSLYTRERYTSEVSDYTSNKMTLGASLGLGYRKKIANRWCVMVSSDYYAARQQFSMSAGQNTHILSLTTGVGFVL
jgi:hypothetical protein